MNYYVEVKKCYCLFPALELFVLFADYLYVSPSYITSLVATKKLSLLWVVENNF